MLVEEFFVENLKQERKKNENIWMEFHVKLKTASTFARLKFVLELSGIY
jgi:hypothetical protein